MRSGKHRGQKKQKRKGAYDKSGGITHDTAAFAFRTKDILKIRSRPRLEPGSDYHYLVRAAGLEPARLLAMEPKGYVTLVKDFQSPPYHKGRASFPTLQKIFGRDRPNTC